MRFGGSAVGTGVLSTASSAVVPSVADGDANLDPSRRRRFRPLRAPCRRLRCKLPGSRPSSPFRRLRVACRCIVVAVFVVCVSFAV